MGGRGTSSGRNSNGGVVNGRRNGVKVGMNLDWFGSGKEVVSKKQKQFDAFRFQGMDVERESKKNITKSELYQRTGINYLLVLVKII